MRKGGEEKVMFAAGEPVSWSTSTWIVQGAFFYDDSLYRLLTLARGGISVFEVLKNSNHTVTVNFGAEGKYCIRLLARLDQGLNRIQVVNYGHHYQLLLNGRLVDEDWPRIPIDINGTVCVQNFIDACIQTGLPKPMIPYEVGQVITIDQVLHDGDNCFFGDCMPMWHDGVYHLFYLYDRRRHGSKCGMSGHRWAHISTTDLVHWTRHPFAVNIDRIEEATFRTGTVMFHDGKFYAFYVILTNDGSPAPVAYSVSTDGIHFEKTPYRFYLDEKYENVGLRDPNVFEDEQGLLHMFLSTKLRHADGTRQGCILHYTAQDVDSWVMDEKPFLVVDMDEYPECSDYFVWNGKYYFSYCIQSVSHYMVSDQPFSGFEYHADQLLGGNGFAVPKSAWFHGRRIAAGFSWTPYFSYGGEPVFLEMLQRPDGKLDFRIPPELC